MGIASFPLFEHSFTDVSLCVLRFLRALPLRSKSSRKTSQGEAYSGENLARAFSQSVNLKYRVIFKCNFLVGYGTAFIPFTEFFWE